MGQGFMRDMEMVTSEYGAMVEDLTERIGEIGDRFLKEVQVSEEVR
jgi:hypothetical protein